MKIIENGNKTYTKFQYVFFNDVFRPKNSKDIYIRVPQVADAYHNDFNAWSLTDETFAFFNGETEVELLDAELHINLNKYLL